MRNEDFLSRDFYGTDGKILDKTQKEIIDTFLEITTIAERRYIADTMTTSGMAFHAGQAAIESAGIDKEALDYIIVAHNFGDVKCGTNRSDIVPSLASRVKFNLGIKNHGTVAYDVIFGCPGWLQAMIQADYYIRSGDAKKILVIGAEALSRVSDPHDRDSLLYADGAGATILEARQSEFPTGILAHATRSDTLLYSKMLQMGQSFNPAHEPGDDLFLKMNGRRLYQYALDTVPQAIKDCLDKSGIHLKEIRKVLIHQANGKMDDAILKRLYSLYGIEEPPMDVMPMTISWLGNSSVATLPTLLDLILHSKVDNHSIQKDDLLVFASVGAGMNINTFIYKA
jgi:3-oxoacyl-[acyl-carrier-protein] synthase-3